MDNLKKPPHSMEAEQAVIGIVLVKPHLWDDVSFLGPSDFYHHMHRTLWDRMAKNESARDIVSMMTDSELDTKIYLAEITRNAPLTANIGRYGQIVRERALLRRLIAECATTIDAAYSMASTPSTVITEHIRRADGLLDGAITTGGLRHVFDITADWYHNARERSKTGKVSGVETGFPYLDKRWGGLRDSTVTIIAGRPKTGKTTLALNIAEHVSRTMPVAMFQMEMGEDEIADRLIAAVAKYELNDIRGGKIPEECDPLFHAIHVLKQSKMHVDANPRQTIDYIRLNAKKFAKEHGKPLIMIDYLGLIEMGGKAGNKSEAVTEVSREVKLLAKELKCPIILLCQMNRNAERESRKPKLSDLRDSGSIEQDADVVCFTHKDSEEQGYSEIITRAIRSGQPGTDYLTCRFNVGRFETPPDGWMPHDENQNQEQRQSSRKPRQSKDPLWGKS